MDLFALTVVKVHSYVDDLFLIVAGNLSVDFIYILRSAKYHMYLVWEERNVIHTMKNDH